MKILTLGIPRYSDWAFKVYEALPNKIESIRDADLIVFTGGSDVDPSVYGHVKHKSTYSDKKRDIFEHEVYLTALELNKPMLGICRGSQFLTACQPGGYVIQHVGGHANGAMHPIVFPGDTREINQCLITSTHHQMMFPFDVKNHEIIAYSPTPRSDKYELGDKELDSLPGGMEPEIVFYPDTKCLCVQGHPEMMSSSSDAVVRIKNLINTKLFNMKKIAVYGSLRSGFGNNRLIEDCELLSTEKVNIPYKMVSLGGFPGLVPSDSNSDITIEIYNVSDDVYRRVERLESYPEFYQKAKIETSEGEVEVYVLLSERYKSLEVVKSGDWKERNK